MSATGEKTFSWGKQVFHTTEVVHTAGTATTFNVPQTATAVAVFGDNTAPSASLGTGSGGEITVTLAAAGGQSGTFYVITRHPNGLASNQN